MEAFGNKNCVCACRECYLLQQEARVQRSCGYIYFDSIESVEMELFSHFDASVDGQITEAPSK